MWYSRAHLSWAQGWVWRRRVEGGTKVWKARSLSPVAMGTLCCEVRWCLLKGEPMVWEERAPVLGAAHPCLAPARAGQRQPQSEVWKRQQAQPVLK